MIVVAVLLLAAAALLVRLGWGGRRVAAWAGWAVTALALLLLARADGAWGIAIGGVAGIVAVLAIVLYAGWREPARVRRPGRAPPSITLPHGPIEFGRRAAVFVLVVPVAFAASQWLAYGMQAVARAGGWADADTTVVMLFAQPALWMALMTWQMTRSGPSAMIAPPLIVGIAGTILWGLA